MRGYFQANSPFDKHSVVAAFLWLNFLCQVGSANGSHFGYLWMIPSKRPMSRTGSSRFLILLIFSSRRSGDIIPETPRVTLSVPSSQREAPKPRFLFVLWNTLRHTLAPLQPRPSCERLELHFSSDSILSGYEDLHLPGSEQFTIRGK